MKFFATVFLVFLLPFFAFSQNRYDVVIDEVMADPSPQAGLPNSEWIELKNTSGVSLNLQGWRVADVSGQSGPMPDFTFLPDSFIILCTASAVTAMSQFGTTISVTSFPSLDNDGEGLFLRSPDGRTIHAVAYSSTWYGNELKKDGGWTLEMIDPALPCAGANNWTAGINAQGGTPGRKNSVDAQLNDANSPKLKYAYALDSSTLIALFDEPIDSLSGATVTNYSIDGGLSVTSAITLDPFLNSVQLTTGKLSPGVVYKITVSNVTDCRNNIIGSSNTAKVGITSEASLLDIVINEILFNPKSNGFDFIEFYNKSDKIIDASKLYAANRNGTGVISSIKQIFPTPFTIFPGDYFVITEDALNLQGSYLVRNPDAIMLLSTMPSYPDDGGDVLLLNAQGAIVDEVVYADDWQFKLVDNPEGVSLERIDPAASSTDPLNWHSAASTAGYGTPTYKNSQYLQTQLVDATITIFPKVFSPDNDGRDDISAIQYKVAEAGYVANITIFDGQGRPVNHLVKNGTLGLTGQWNWNGLDEQGNKLPIGTYIVYSEIFNLHGKKQSFKNAVVLARKLN